MIAQGEQSFRGALTAIMGELGKEPEMQDGGRSPISSPIC
jgi:hypothetical protein